MLLVVAVIYVYYVLRNRWHFPSFFFRLHDDKKNHKKNGKRDKKIKYYSVLLRTVLVVNTVPSTRTVLSLSPNGTGVLYPVSRLERVE